MNPVLIFCKKRIHLEKKTPYTVKESLLKKSTNCASIMASPQLTIGSYIRCFMSLDRQTLSTQPRVFAVMRSDISKKLQICLTKLDTLKMSSSAIQPSLVASSLRPSSAFLHLASLKESVGKN